MFEKNSGTDIFSLERRPRPSIITSTAEPFSPYAEAWKEFDKLQKWSKGEGLPRLVRFAFEILTFGGAAFASSQTKGTKRGFFLFYCGALIAEAIHSMIRRQRFAHWPCPRCHAEWPGTKTEKESACGVCRLRLHQLTP
jgi:hypothetical protein